MSIGNLAEFLPFRTLKKNGKLPEGIGRNSPVDVIPCGKGVAKSIHEAIVKDGDMRAAVLKVNGEQVMFAIRGSVSVSRSRWSSTSVPTMSIEIPARFVARLARFKNASGIWDRIVADLSYCRPSDVTQRAEEQAIERLAEPNARSMILNVSASQFNTIAAGFAEADEKSAWTVILPDDDRTECHRKRAQNKPYGFDEKANRRRLFARLEALKASRSARFESMDAVVDAVRANGYPEKFTVGEWTFKLREIEGRLENLLGNDRFHDERRPKFAVVYEIDPSQASAYRAKREELREAAGDHEVYITVAEKINRFEHALPPSKVYVVLGLKGGTIEPTGYRGDPNYYW